MKKISIGLIILILLITGITFIKFIGFKLTKHNNTNSTLQISPLTSPNQLNLANIDLYKNPHDKSLNTINLAITDSQLTDPKTNEQFAKESTNNNFQTYFKAQASSLNLAQMVKVISQNNQLVVHQISYSLDTSPDFGSPKNSTGIAENNTITYKNIFPYVDLRFTVKNDQLLEEFLVQNPITAAKITRLPESFSANNLTYTKNQDGSIDFFSTADKTLVFQIPKPVMYEQNNRNQENFGLHYEITQDNDRLILTKVIDKEGYLWFSDPVRKYPIAIDATTVDTSTSSAPTAYSFQRKTWYDGTRYWSAFYSLADTRIEFWYSTDGSSWTENTAARITTTSSDFSIDADSSNAFISYTTDSTASTEGLVSSGLVGQWKMNESSWNGTADEVVDASGTGNHGQAVGGATTASGKFSNGGSFDGADDYVNAGNDASLSITGEMTVCAWINADSLAGDIPLIVANFDVSGNAQYIFGVDFDGYLTFQWANLNNFEYYYTADAVITTGQWYHVCGVRISDSSVKLYVNGIEKSVTTAGNYAIPTARGDTLISGTNATYNWDGLIDDVRIYNSVLSAANIAILGQPGYDIETRSASSYPGTGFSWSNPTVTYNGSGVGPEEVVSSNLVGQWKLNETTANSCTGGKDSCDSVSTNHGDWINHATNTAGKFGSGITLDGTDDYVSIADNDAFSFGNGTTDSAFSLSAWVNMTDATYFFIASKTATTTLTPEWLFYVDDADKLNLVLYDNASGDWVASTSDSAITAYEGSWVHLAATYSGNGVGEGIKFYVNGSLVASTASSQGTYVAMHNTTDLVYIGGVMVEDATWKGFANGKIDDMRIYNAVVSASDVAIIANSTGSGLYSYPAITRDSASKVWINSTLTSSTNYIINSIQSTSANDITAWGTATALDTSTNSNKYGVITPSGSGEVYAVWIDNATIEGKEYASSAWAGSPTSIATGVSGLTTSLSAVGDASNNVHLVYIDSSNNTVYREYTTSWQAAVTLDSNAGNTYPVIFINSTDLYALWVRSNSIYYKKAVSPYASGNWDADATSFYSTGTNTYLSAGYQAGNAKTYLQWTNGTGSPYSVIWDSITAPTPTPASQNKIDINGVNFDGININ